LQYLSKLWWNFAAPFKSFTANYKQLKDFTDLLGRILLSFIFLYEAYDSIFFFKETKAKMDFFGLKWQPDFLLYGAIIVLVMGGLMILSGYRSSFGAFLLLLYWVPVTFIVHDFWHVPDSCRMSITCPEIGVAGEEIYRRMQGVLFMKNLAIMGGLLMVMVNGSGKYSIKRLFATTRVAGA
jgi:putative oxidoreductase